MLPQTPQSIAWVRGAVPAAGATALVAGVAGQRIYAYFLVVRSEGVGAAPILFFQDTTPTSYWSTDFGVIVQAWVDFQGFAFPVGLGAQLKSGGVITPAVDVTFGYSQY
jgi:hypothetical protein